jgi:hypothetical protein
MRMRRPDYSPLSDAAPESRQASTAAPKTGNAVWRNAIGTVAGHRDMEALVAVQAEPRTWL